MLARWTIAALALVSFAWAWTQMLAMSALEHPPAGFVLEQPDTPITMLSQGDLPVRTGWPLGRHQGFYADGAGPVEALVEVPETGALFLVLQSGEQRVVLSLPGGRPAEVRVGDERPHCRGELPSTPTGPIRARLEVGEQVVAEVDGQRVQCDAAALPPMKRMGISAENPRAAIHELNGQTPPGLRLGVLVGFGLGGLALVGGLGWWLRDRARWVPLSTLPMLLCAPLAYADAEAVRKSLRVPAEQPRMLLVLLPVVLTCTLLALGGASAAARTRRPWIAPVVTALAVFGLAIAVGGSPAAAGATAGLATAAVGVVTVNVARTRGFNVLSLVGVVAIAVLGEVALRHSRVGPTWTTAAASDRVLDGYEALKEREYTAYPLSGYPVEPDPRTHDVRVVALGGSSTGGAYLNDDLDVFWPAQLGALHPQIQVVNQGVGGWTTVHIRRYLDEALDDLDPDILVLYVGFNDANTPSPIPYAEIFAGLDGPSATDPSSWLGAIRMYQGLRFGLSTLVGAPEGVAVPAHHTQDNLEAILELAREDGRRVLIAREAASTRLDWMSGHEAAMRAVAESGADDVAYADVATVIEGRHGTGLFLDDVHLTEKGHRTAAGVFGERLVELGWLTASAE